VVTKILKGGIDTSPAMD